MYYQANYEVIFMKVLAMLMAMINTQAIIISALRVFLATACGVFSLLVYISPSLHFSPIEEASSKRYFARASQLSRLLFQSLQ